MFVGVETGTGTIENSMEAPWKIKNRTTILSSNSISRNISKRNKNTILNWYQHPHIHHSIIYNSQDIKTTEVSIKGRMDRDLRMHICVFIYLHIYICIHIILFSHKKEENLAICDNMMVHSVMQSQRKTNTIWSHLYVKS